MRNLKKILSASLALVLAVSLVACNKADDKGSQEINKSNDEVQVDPAKLDFEAENLPNYDGKGVTLSYYTVGTAPEDLKKVQDKINEYLKEKMNISVEITYMSWSDYGSNMNTIINGGEKYDMAFGSPITGVNRFIHHGLFADVSKLLPAAPNLEALIPKDVWQGVTLGNGAIFGVPAYKDSSATQYWVWDEEMVNKYNIDYKNIITLDDMTPVLELLKKENPQMYPMYLNKSGINSLNFEYEPLAGGIGVLFGTTKAVNIYAEEQVQNKFRTLAKWHELGYINPDAGTLDEVPKGDNNIFSAQGFPGAEVGWGKYSHGAPVVTNPRLGPMYTSGTIQGSYMVISAGSSNQEAAIKLLERINVDKYLRNLFNYGIEGVHFEKVEGKENTVVRTEDGAKKYNVPSYSQGQFMNLYVEDPNPEDQWLKVAEQNTKAETSPILGFVFNPDSVETEIAGLENVTEKYFSALNTGSTNPDQALEDMLKEMEAVGVEKVIEEAQKQIDEFLAAKK